MEINKRLTPYNHNIGTVDRIIGIVIHYVGALGGAKANCDYYAGGNRKASAHYFVDFDGSIWQSVEDNNIAFHCGADKYIHPYLRNANTIGIEMCVRNDGDNMSAESRDWYFEDATVRETINLTKYLMIKYNIKPKDVVRHYDIMGKICPNPYVYNHTKHVWNTFKEALVGRSWVESPETQLSSRGDEHMSMENIQTQIILTDNNRAELERIYGKIPPENEILEAPQTHTFEEAQGNSLEGLSETEEVVFDEISE